MRRLAVTVGICLHSSLPSHSDINTKEFFNPLKQELPPKPVFVEEENESPETRYKRHCDNFPKPLRLTFESVLFPFEPEDTIDLTNANIATDHLKQLFHLIRHYHQLLTIILTGNAINAERMKELVVGLEAQEKLEDLDLANCSLSDEAVEVLCEVLPRLKSLRQVRISGNNLSSKSLAKVIDAITGSKVVSIWVSHNEMGVEAAEALGRLFSRNKLEIVGLAHMSMTAEHVQKFNASLRMCRTLKQLHINDNPLFGEGVKALCLNLPWSIEIFDISAVGMGHDAARSLGLGITSLVSLHTLRVDRNTLEDEGLQFLAAPLSRHSHLQHFSASRNSLTSFAVAQLYTFIEHTRHLRTIRLAYNHLGDSVAGLRNHILTVRHLDLRQCRVYFHLELKRELKGALLDLTTDVDF